MSQFTGKILNPDGTITVYDELEYFTSISDAPKFIGQEAIVDGVWYKATGTSATSDWKQITNA